MPSQPNSVSNTGVTNLSPPDSIGGEDTESKKKKKKKKKKKE